MVNLTTGDSRAKKEYAWWNFGETSSYGCHLSSPLQPPLPFLSVVFRPRPPSPSALVASIWVRKSWPIKKLCGPASFKLLPKLKFFSRVCKIQCFTWKELWAKLMKTLTMTGDCFFFAQTSILMSPKPFAHGCSLTEKKSVGNILQLGSERALWKVGCCWCCFFASSWENTCFYFSYSIFFPPKSATPITQGNMKNKTFVTNSSVLGKRTLFTDQ